MLRRRILCRNDRLILRNCSRSLLPGLLSILRKKSLSHRPFLTDIRNGKPGILGEIFRGLLVKPFLHRHPGLEIKIKLRSGSRQNLRDAQLAETGCLEIPVPDLISGDGHVPVIDAVADLAHKDFRP